MQNFYQKFDDYLSSLSLREKVLMLFVAMAVIYAIWDFIFFGAFISQKQENQSKINEVQSESIEIDSKISEITNLLIAQGNPNKALKQDIDKVQQQIESAEEQLNDTFNSLVPPKEVTEFIRSLMQNNSDIKLTSLNNEPVEIIDIAENEASETEPQNSSSAHLYKHATNIQLTTNYIALYDYLTQLEQSQWALYWDQLEYKVTDYPQAEVKLRVYTLSSDEHWLGL